MGNVPGMRSGGVAAVVALLTLAACSGDDDSASATTTAPPPPTTNETTTTLAATTTTHATTTTDATTTSAPPETTASTTEPPTTTLDPDDLAANTLAIIETVERSFEIYNAALNDPFNDEKVAALSEVYTPRVVEGWMNIINEYRENDYRSLPNPELPARYDVDINSVEINLRAGTGSAQVCHLSSFIKIQIAGAADGSDLVIDDEITRQVEQLELVQEDGIWKINGASLPADSEVVTSCE